MVQKLMRAWAVERFGDPKRERSLLSLEELQVPKVHGRDVRIRMYGAEIGDWDALVASGDGRWSAPFRSSSASRARGASWPSART